MYPQFIIFEKTIGTYTFLSLLGILAAGAALFLLNRKRALRSDQLLHISLTSIAGLFIGAHLLYGITQLPEVLDVLFNKRERLSTIKDVFLLFGQGFGGMVFYGGLFGGLLGGYLYCKSLKLDFRIYGNALAPGIPLFHAFGRIGCFLSGCCYGIESRWGFTYENSLYEEADHVQRFPVQLLEASLELILFIILAVLLVKFNNQFSLIRIYLTSYACIRFLDEFLRGDGIRGTIGPFSTSQWISLVLLIILITTFFIKKQKTRKLN